MLAVEENNNIQAKGPMKIKLKLFDPKLPLPQYQSEKAAGIDLYTRLNIQLPPQQVTLVPLNVAMKIPENHFVLLTARSSLQKKGLMMANGVGIGDADYCGENDEYYAALFNFSNQVVELKKGERIVQMIILSRKPVEVIQINQLMTTNRGGFGSTGE